MFTGWRDTLRHIHDVQATRKGDHRMTIITQLTGYNSPENAYVIPDYPYGFTTRTEIRFWIDTTKTGQRFCSQTLNPRTGQWNNPKRSTYSQVRVFGINENGHIENDGIGSGCYEDDITKFGTTYLLDDGQKAVIEILRRIAQFQKQASIQRRS